VSPFRRAVVLGRQRGDQLRSEPSRTVAGDAGQVLIVVGAPHFSADPRIAQTVLALISKKLI